MKKLDLEKKTKTYTYMLPLLGMSVSPYKGEIVNAFLGDEDYPKLTDHIFVLFRFKGDKDFVKFESKVEEDPMFEISYDPDKKYVMKVFKMPYAHADDFASFKASKYSHLSLPTKTRIMAFHHLPQDHAIMDVLHKREVAFLRLEMELNKYPGVSKITVGRDLEASGVLNLTREVYNANYKSVDPFTTAREQFLEKGAE
tara:strand:+ start:88 stop:684 length:597 start_codon:yes stop_codon:yes gene_type:complete